MDAVAQLFDLVRRRGVQFWLQDGRLRYRAPRGVLTPADIEWVRAHERQITAFLDRTAAAAATEPWIVPRERRDHAPLALSQLAHWNLYQLGERRSKCHVASAIRLRGSLNVKVLEKSIVEIVRRHDALRTRIVILDGVPTQVTAENGGVELEIDDLTALPDELRESEVHRLMGEHALRPIDMALDPLFAVRLLRVCDGEHVLIVAMEHIISDGRSMGIFLRELITAYTQTVRGEALSLPEIPIQFPDYAAWQRVLQEPWLEERIARREAHLLGGESLRFPAHRNASAEAQPGVGVVRFRIDRALENEWREWCKRQRTTLVMSACAAYVGLVLRWCNVSDGVIRYQTDGRFSPRTQDTIGYFAFPLYLRVQLFENDTFVDLINRVTEEYCRAQQDADYSYIEAQTPRPEFTNTTRFNWAMHDQTSAYLQVDGSHNSITFSNVFYQTRVVGDFEMDSDPMLGFSETTEEIRGVVAFSVNRSSFEAMQKFADSFLVFLEALLHQPHVRVRDVTLLQTSQ